MMFESIIQMIIRMMVGVPAKNEVEVCILVRFIATITISTICGSFFA
jgi:hypothetical protein